MNAGHHVIIRDNPHDRTMTGIIGVIREVQPGAGLGGRDLFLVAYTDPFTGLRHSYPFSADMLKSARCPNRADPPRVRH